MLYHEGLENIKQIITEQKKLGNESSKRATEVANMTRKIKSQGKTLQVRIENVTMLNNSSFISSV
jgi:hypothetical protein